MPNFTSPQSQPSPRGLASQSEKYVSLLHNIPRSQFAVVMRVLAPTKCTAKINKRFCDLHFQSVAFLVTFLPFYGPVFQFGLWELRNPPTLCTCMRTVTGWFQKKMQQYYIARDCIVMRARC